MKRVENGISSLKKQQRVIISSGIIAPMRLVSSVTIFLITSAIAVAHSRIDERSDLHFTSSFILHDTFRFFSLMRDIVFRAANSSLYRKIENDAGAIR